MFGYEDLGASNSNSEALLPMWAGFVAAGISVVGFGSMFVPAKRFHSGDGVFYQWVMCSAIWCVGLCLNAYRGFPKFEPVAMLGGALWCVGNVMAIPIIQMVGLALGMALWGVSNLCLGWASGAFGILGVNKQPANHPTLNYVGAAVAVCSVVVFATIQSNTGDSKSAKSHVDVEYRVLIDVTRSDSNIQQESDEQTAESSVIWKGIKAMGPKAKRVVGVVLALASGVCYGCNFNPSTWRIDHGPAGTSRNPLDYVFAHFTGIFATSTLLMILYSAINKNSPAVFRRVVLPGFASGIIWAISQISWFVANPILSFPISFPIIASGPALVASLWGVIVFREIRGKVQLIKLLIAFVVTITGVVLIALSKLLK